MRLAAILFATANAPAQAAFVIAPTYDASIMADSNFATPGGLKDNIEAAISLIESKYTDPITVTITFKKDTSPGNSLGSSSTFFANLPYSTYFAALTADSSTANDATALSLIGGVNNPVNGNANINVKTANLRAVGIPVFPTSGNTDGTISLNTDKTHAGSGSGTTGQFNLMAVVEHEMDEVLGLGSALPNIPTDPIPLGTIFPEDLFRYHIPSSGSPSRSFTTANTADVYFSIDGTTKIAQFDNQGDEGDYGDWQSNPLPAATLPQVQDAFATIGSNPTFGNSEFEALDVIGFTPVPESSDAIRIVMGSLTGVFLCSAWLRRKAAAVRPRSV